MELGLSPENFEKRNAVRLDLASKLNMEVASWKQKAREKWLKDGDKNMGYFHCLANHRRRCNYVEDPLVDSVSISGNKKMREAAKSFF